MFNNLFFFKLHPYSQIFKICRQLKIESLLLLILLNLRIEFNFILSSLLDISNLELNKVFIFLIYSNQAMFKNEFTL